MTDTTPEGRSAAEQETAPEPERAPEQETAAEPETSEELDVEGPNESAPGHHPDPESEPQ